MALYVYLCFSLIEVIAESVINQRAIYIYRYFDVCFINIHVIDRFGKRFLCLEDHNIWTMF